MSRRPGVSLYVRQLPDDVRSDDLRTLFDKYGPVRDIYVPLDYYTRRPRGFCYVEYEDERDAEDGLNALDGYRYHGCTLEIEFAMGDRKTPGQMKNKYGPTTRYDDRDRRGGGRSRRSPVRDRHRDRSGDRDRKRRRRSPSMSRSRSRSAVIRKRSRSPRRGSVSPIRRRSRGSQSPIRRRSRKQSARSPSASRSPSRDPIMRRSRSKSGTPIAIGGNRSDSD